MPGYSRRRRAIGLAERQHRAVEHGRHPMTRLLTAAALITALTVPAVATTESCAMVRKTPDGFLNMRYQPKMGQ